MVLMWGFFFCHIVLLILMIAPLMNCTNIGFFPSLFVVCGVLMTTLFASFAGYWAYSAFVVMRVLCDQKCVLIVA